MDKLVEKVARKLWDWDYEGCSPTWEQGSKGGMTEGYIAYAKEIILIIRKAVAEEIKNILFKKMKNILHEGRSYQERCGYFVSDEDWHKFWEGY